MGNSNQKSQGDEVVFCPTVLSTWGTWLDCICSSCLFSSQVLVVNPSPYCISTLTVPGLSYYPSEFPDPSHIFVNRLLLNLSWIIIMKVCHAFHWNTGSYILNHFSFSWHWDTTAFIMYIYNTIIHYVINNFLIFIASLGLALSCLWSPSNSKEIQESGGWVVTQKIQLPCMHLNHIGTSVSLSWAQHCSHALQATRHVSEEI